MGDREAEESEKFESCILMNHYIPGIDPGGVGSVNSMESMPTLTNRAAHGLSSGADGARHEQMLLQSEEACSRDSGMHG